MARNSAVQLLLTRGTDPEYLRGALAAINTDTCTRHISNGAAAIVSRVCLFHGAHDAGGCSSCFVMKRGRVDKERRDLLGVPVREAQLLLAIMRRLYAKNKHGQYHIPRVLSVQPDPDLPNSTIIAMEEVPDAVPLSLWSPGLANMEPGQRAVVSRILPDAMTLSDLEWRAVWLQLVGTMADVQDVIIGFQHNDLHHSNILLRRNVPGAITSSTSMSTSTISTSTRHECIFHSFLNEYAASPDLLVSLIDFGWSGARDFPMVRSSPTPDAFAKSPLIDLHHAVIHTYLYWRELANRLIAEGTPTAGKIPAWFEPWEAFLLRWLPPSSLVRANLNMFKFPVDRTKVIFLSWGTAVSAGLARILDDPYFGPFRRTSLPEPPPPVTEPTPPTPLTMLPMDEDDSTTQTLATQRSAASTASSSVLRRGTAVSMMRAPSAESGRGLAAAPSMFRAAPPAYAMMPAIPTRRPQMMQRTLPGMLARPRPAAAPAADTEPMELSPVRAPRRDGPPPPPAKRKRTTTELHDARRDGLDEMFSQAALAFVPAPPVPTARRKGKASPKRTTSKRVAVDPPMSMEI